MLRLDGKQRRVRIIAEAGVNHNGDRELAFKLVEAAREAGADMVKFQVFKASALVSAAAPKAEYQQKLTDAAESQLEMIRRLELSSDVLRELAAHCAEAGIGFLATPFDNESIMLLAAMGVSMIKIPSGEITNLPYLRKVGGLGCELLLSTGMSTLEEIGATLFILEKAGTPASQISLLHCTTEYPAPFEEVNLLAMYAMREAFPGVRSIGYSDHTMGIAVSVAAAAVGAAIIEKHFTLDRSMEGPDHKASLEPAELSRMVQSIRQVEAALGDGKKVPVPSEKKNIAVVRKSIVAACRIRRGEIFSEKNVTTKRPGSGVSPMLWDQLLGARADRDYEQDECIAFTET